jgi:glycosyltransferase involved in cell wall biosynthesis
MRRVLILCEYPTLLGGERSMLTTLPAIREAGFEVHVAAPGGGRLAAVLHDAGVRHIAWRVCNEGGARLPLKRLRDDIAALLHELRPDLVHANSLSMARIAGPVTAQRRVPSLGHIRDIVTLSRQAVDDVNANRQLVAVSHATRDFHVNQGIAGKKCFVSYNGVDLNEFHLRPPNGYLHQELRLHASTRLIVTISQIGPRKGTDIVLRAASEIAAKAPDVHWVIVGERTSNKAESREFEVMLNSAAHAPPLMGRVHFLGSRNDVPQLLNECVLLVHGARQEPLGRALLEAAASGVAVVATDVGGTREIFPTDLSGAILVPPDDAKAMADAMLALLRDDPRRQSFARAARSRATDAFDIRCAAQRLIEHYEAVVSE